MEKGLTGLSEVDLVVEAVAEIESVKRQVFRECDEVVPRHAVLASNTSSISLTRIAAVTSRPEQVGSRDRTDVFLEEWVDGAGRRIFLKDFCWVLIYTCVCVN